jgi:lactate permease
MSLMSLLLTVVPVAIILIMLLVFRKPADISGVVGWVAVALIAFLFFQTNLEVVLRSTAAGIIRSLPVSLIVATSLLQITFIEKTGGLKRITIFIKTLSPQARAAQIMMVNIGFGSLMVAVGATPVSILPPILLAMGYSTYMAIALPAIGYDSLCTYALLGAPIVAFVDIANAFLKDNPINGVSSITLAQAGSIFFWFLPLSSILIGFCMLWIVGRGKAIREGWLPCLITGAVIGVISYFTNLVENTVVLTGVLCGIGVIFAMVAYLRLTGRKVIDRSLLTDEETAYAKAYPLWKALTPWFILVVLILALNLPQPVFNYLYRTLTLPIRGVAANDALVNGIATRALWSAYTWILVSVLLAIPFIRPTKSQWRDILKTWGKRAPRPVFSAAIFFAIGEIMNMSGFSMTSQTWQTPSMVKVLADYSAQFFQGAYSFIAGFIGLFGGFITGSEASTIGMFAKYALATVKNLNMPLSSLIIITASLAFGGGLASVISPAKLQNAAASIDKLGEENKVIRTAFVFSLLLTLVMSLFVVLLLKLNIKI